MYWPFSVICNSMSELLNTQRHVFTFFWELEFLETIKCQPISYELQAPANFDITKILVILFNIWQFSIFEYLFS